MSESMESKSEQPQAVLATCPFLGIETDKSTSFNFASAYNACHRCVPICTPSLSYQRSFCLSKEYPNCIVFTHEPGKKVPPEIIGARHDKPKLPWWVFLIIGLALALLVFLVIYANNLLPLNREPKQTPTETNVAISAVTSLPTSLPLVETSTPDLAATQATLSQATAMPAATIAPPRAPRWLDTPFGGDHKFVVHKVISGESLLFLASKYSTSVEAIKSLNYILYTPLWIDSIVIVPVETVDVVELPAFEPYMVENNGISLEQVAVAFEVDLDELAYYNNLDPQTICQQGEWLILPRERRNWQ